MPLSLTGPPKAQRGTAAGFTRAGALRTILACGNDHTRGLSAHTRE